jgi:hypothetical protein
MKKQLFEFLGSTDVQEFFKSAVITPLLDNIFQYLYPYFLGIFALWGIMLICIVVILFIILRSGMTSQMGVK